jgi:heterodisulfide reductase subunit C
VEAVNLSEIGDQSRQLIGEIAEAANVNLLDCYQCGKCSAGCPMTDAMDMRPQQVIRHLQLGILEPALEARGPWICAGCEVCSARCPQNVHITDLMREVRRASKATGHHPVPASDVFEEQFIKGVRKYGRSSESRLAMKFNLGSGHLLQDVAGAPKMLQRGMISLRETPASCQPAVAELIDRCFNEEGGAHE